MVISKAKKVSQSINLLLVSLLVACLLQATTTALIGGCLGSGIDEDRSKTRYSMGIAEA